MTKIFITLCLLLALQLQAEQGTTQLQEQLRLFNPEAIKLAANDLQQRDPKNYNPQILQKILSFDKQTLMAGLKKNDLTSIAATRELLNLQQQLLLSDPLINFDEILLVKRKRSQESLKRKAKADAYGLPTNWQGNTSIDGTVWDNEISTLSLKKLKQPLKSIYKPTKNYFVGDVDLHFDGKKMIFSSLDKQGRWQIFEVGRDGKNLRQVSQSPCRDIDNYDPCYLPNGRIIFTSTTGFQGVPCVGGKDHVANLHIMDNNGLNWRRLTFDQEQNWSPTVLPNGQIIYQRWEYTDSAHYFSRVLMIMNPDGTGQRSFYGSNSYWPNTLFYARPIPGSNSKFATIVSGHHGVRRAGELLLFDSSKGTFEAKGAVQKFPGRGKKVIPVIKDNLVGDIWPRFLHPFPLDEARMIVSCQPEKDAAWGIYLVDKYDNICLLREEGDYALLEPLPLRKSVTPRIIPDRVKPDKRDASVFIADIYEGPGLKGVPRGTVKKVRVYQYEYAYRNMGGHYNIGMEGPWDVRRLLGTADVYEDGSTSFKIPANRPLAFQPLDEEGKSLQGMRSWFTAMPGERVSCIGCHESPNTAPPAHSFRALTAAIQNLKKPKKQLAGFSFLRDIQPVLDKNCVGCHDGSSGIGKDTKVNLSKQLEKMAGHTAAYQDLHPFVRRNGPEGDYHMLTPGEFHADTSELIQMLQKGHHNVKLNKEEWLQLSRWIDLNVPDYGTWSESGKIPDGYAEKRSEMKKFFNIEEDVETPPEPYKAKAFVAPAPTKAYIAPDFKLQNWPFKVQTIMQKMKLELSPGVDIELVRIPAGEFVMGNAKGANDEKPLSVQNIAKPFWMASRELTLKQFRQFRTEHKNGWYDMHYKDQVKRGYNMNDESFPVIRVSWQEAMEFCAWLSKKSGKKVTLPTEAQWEWACRAGSDKEFSYGSRNVDFSRFANLADQSLSKMAVSGVNPQPIKNPNKYWDFIPKDDRFNDHSLHLAKAKAYTANAFGLQNMHGNVAEWTRDNYAPYPYAAGKAGVKKVIRGGSWRDRPFRASSSFRLGFPAWQKVYNVGFRIIIEDK